MSTTARWPLRSATAGCPVGETRPTSGSHGPPVRSGTSRGSESFDRSVGASTSTAASSRASAAERPGSLRFNGCCCCRGENPDGCKTACITGRYIPSGVRISREDDAICGWPSASGSCAAATPAVENWNPFRACGLGIRLR